MGSPPRSDARDALADAAARFTFSATPRLDAELLLAHALGITRERLLLTLADHTAPPAFAALVERRAAHEPIAYITGTRAFWTIDLRVAPGALIPRADSETLIEAAVAHFAGTAGPRRVLDLGTGSGALLLAALDQWPGASGVGLDASPAALTIARDNAVRIAPGRATIAAGGWEGTGEAFDLILCNPPYIATGAALPPEVVEYEPASALFAGPDGLDDYRIIAALLGRQIAPDGVACIEIGHDQQESAAALFRAAGLAVALRRDLAGRDRCLVVTS
ncbi:peptide chain release factor N(5)-glutamine methyltransferase [Sphingomonas sp. CL5.1]|uniref:peptide chain release factor N(5)-glutamine methyltransferase n=1 Tax=Sphingomonas sp. CL5.1 TaxID=2653203 RepID=UPI0020C649B6|nr:peptide chain release factor N(5)-glutamine methyltransferase [Sphingomonas sp. CL5.1]